MIYGICLFEVSFNFKNFAQRSKYPFYKISFDTYCFVDNFDRIIYVISSLIIYISYTSNYNTIKFSTKL